MSAPAGIGAAPARRQNLWEWLSNPWAETRFLWLIGIAYIVWTMIPLIDAVIFSFNKGRSTTIWQGFSLRWYTGDPLGSVLHSPELQSAVVQSLKLASLTAVISVPVGVAFALSLRRWRGRAPGTANFLMMFSFVTPELILAVSLFLLYTHAFKVVGTGTVAQLSGLVVLALAYPVVIVRARLLSLGDAYEEAGLDLGASPTRTLWRITLPLLGPSIFASAAIIFAFSLDDFVIVNQLATGSTDQTVAMYIYVSARTGATPAANAIGTLMLATSTILIAIAFVVYRRAAKKIGDRP